MEDSPVEYLQVSKPGQALLKLSSQCEEQQSVKPSIISCWNSDLIFIEFYLLWCYTFSWAMKWLYSDSGNCCNSVPLTAWTSAKASIDTCYQLTTSSRVKRKNKLYHKKSWSSINLSAYQYCNIWMTTSYGNLDLGFHYSCCCYCSQKKYNLDYQSSRKHLGRFGLISHAHTIKTKDLSGQYWSKLFAWTIF